MTNTKYFFGVEGILIGKFSDLEFYVDVLQKTRTYVLKNGEPIGVLEGEMVDNTAVILKATPVQTVTYIDPPSGWKYGFPRSLPPGIEDMTAWLIEQGYPENEVELALKYSRYWTEFA